MRVEVTTEVSQREERYSNDFAAFVTYLIMNAYRQVREQAPVGNVHIHLYVDVEEKR